MNFSVTPATEDLGAAQLEDQLCDLDESILHIKQGFAERLKQDVEQIAISFNGKAPDPIGCNLMVASLTES